MKAKATANSGWDFANSFLYMILGNGDRPVCDGLLRYPLSVKDFKAADC